jgi:tRNA(fMet)-specific endonuclease VapC
VTGETEPTGADPTGTAVADSAAGRIGLLDTSAVILLGRLADPGLLPADSRISAITLAELSVGPLVAATESERAARQAHLQYAEADFDPLPFDSAAARAFGQVAASLRASGRKPSARSYDAMIAATAVSQGIPLYTFNPGDFEGIENLTVVALPHPDHTGETREAQ